MYRKYIDLDEKGKSEGCYAIDLGPFISDILILAIQFAIAELMLRRP